MPEIVDSQVSPIVASRVHRTPCRPAPPPSRFAAVDWPRLSFGLPRRKIILLGLSVFGIAGICVLVKKGKLTFPDLPDLPDMPNLPSLPNLPTLHLPNLRQLYGSEPQPEDPEKPKTINLGQCKFGYEDVFDVESVITGFGSYDWEQTHKPATQTAVTVTLVLNAGAVSTGKQSMDEFGLSLFGRNKRDGDAENPVAPKHFAGGAACGSGVAVASNAVDFALAVDTMGGVRIPAAFCGIFGYRASHGVISTVGVIPVATSLDVVGVLARDPYMLHQVAKVLLQQPELEWGRPLEVLIADDCFGLSTISSVRTADILSRAITDSLGLRQSRKTCESWDALSLQCTDFAEFFDGGGATPQTRHIPIHDLRWTSRRHAINIAMDALLVLPSTPSLPPIKTARGKELEIFESRALSMLSIATMAGCCQVTVPLGNVRGVPISVSVLARYGADIFLLESLININPKLQLEVDVIKQKKPIVKDEIGPVRTSLNERDVPTRPKLSSRTNKGERAGSRSQREESASRAQTFQDNKENNQPREK